MYLLFNSANQLFIAIMYGTVTLTAPTSVVDNLAATPGIRTVQPSWLPPSDTDPNTIIENNYNLTCIPQIADLATIKMNYSQSGMHRVVGFQPATEYNSLQQCWIWTIRYDHCSYYG